MTVPWIVAAVIVAVPLLAAATSALFTALVAGLVEAAIPPLGTVLAVRGARLRCLDEGHGPPIVMLHGLTGNLRNFTYALTGTLKATHRVIVLERPGNGYSTATSESAGSLDGQAAVLAAALEALDLPKPPLVVGHSLGGTVALALAVRRPDLVGGLALLAPLTAASVSLPAGFRLLASPSRLKRWVVAWFVATPASLLFGRRAGREVFFPDAPPPDFGSRGGNFLSLRPEASIATAAEIVAVGTGLAALQRRYGEIRCPVGVLFGMEDRALDPETHIAALADHLDDLLVERVAEAGHMSPLTDAARSCAFIRSMAKRAAAPQLSEAAASLK